MTGPAQIPINAGVPTLAEVREWSGVRESVLSDAQLARIINAELDLQYQRCFVDDPMPDALAQAILRRCARTIAARGLPLGLTGFDAEYGAAFLPRLDVEIERYEAPYMIIATA